MPWQPGPPLLGWVATGGQSKMGVEMVGWPVKKGVEMSSPVVDCWLARVVEDV